MSRGDALPTERKAGTICETVHRWAERKPDAPAFIAEGRFPLTYSALAELMVCFGNALNGSGLGRGDRIAVDDGNHELGDIWEQQRLRREVAGDVGRIVEVALQCRRSLAGQRERLEIQADDQVGAVDRVEEVGW